MVLWWNWTGREELVWCLTSVLSSSVLLFFDQVVRKVPEKTTAFYYVPCIPCTTVIYFLIWFFSLYFWSLIEVWPALLSSKLKMTETSLVNFVCSLTAQGIVSFMWEKKNPYLVLLLP